VNRRTFLRDAVALAGAAAFAASAQSPRVPRIGYLSLQSRSDRRLDAFLDGMREQGYVDGKTIAIEWRFTDGNSASLAR